MEKINKIITVAVILLMIVIVGLCVYAVTKKDNSPIITDALKFKTEYELLNGTANSYGQLYPEVNLDKENPIIYKTAEEIVEILNQETAIIYFGSSDCPWSRNMISILMDVAKNNNVEKIYYVDISNIRDEYVLTEDSQIKKVKEGTEGYLGIVKYLDKYLDEFFIENTDGELVDTNVKRLLSPTVLGIKQGRVISIHAGTLASQVDPYLMLNQEQKEELYNIYNDLVNLIYGSLTCGTSDNC